MSTKNITLNLIDALKKAGLEDEIQRIEKERADQEVVNGNRNKARAMIAEAKKINVNEMYELTAKAERALISRADYVIEQELGVEWKQLLDKAMRVGEYQQNYLSAVTTLRNDAIRQLLESGDDVAVRQNEKMNDSYVAANAAKNHKTALIEEAEALFNEANAIAKTHGWRLTSKKER